MSSHDLGEQVRLPGIINMDLEATKIRSGDEACVVTEEKMLHLNIPLQISVDTKGLNAAGVYSPTVGKVSRGPSSDDRGRISSSTLQPRSRTPNVRVRSASVGRDKKQEMAARYWAVLFENLRRSVDDLYRTCEGDESAVAAKEVLMVLENYVKDFKNLITWLKLNTEYEKTPAPARPTSLTWDIRKTSPAGRNTPTGSGKLTPTRQLLLCSPAKRQLNFDEKEENRSRTVSETIKESNREHEMSPSDVTDVSEPNFNIQKNELNLQRTDFSLQENDLNIEDIETDANVSEHEKSDSEQEKHDKGDSEHERSDSPLLASNKIQDLEPDNDRKLESDTTEPDNDKKREVEPDNDKEQNNKSAKSGQNDETDNKTLEKSTTVIKEETKQETASVEESTKETKKDVKKAEKADTKPSAGKPGAKEAKSAKGKDTARDKNMTTKSAGVKDKQSAATSSSSTSKQSVRSTCSTSQQATTPGATSKTTFASTLKNSAAKPSTVSGSNSTTATKSASTNGAVGGASTTSGAAKSSNASGASNSSVAVKSSGVSGAVGGANNSNGAAKSSGVSGAVGGANTSNGAAKSSGFVGGASNSGAAKSSGVSGAVGGANTSNGAAKSSNVGGASNSSGAAKFSSVATTGGRSGNVPLTRALTTMSGPSGSSRPPLSGRRSNAGLLITSQKLQDRKVDGNRNYGQNRITLVARQTQFAQSNRRIQANNTNNHNNSGGGKTRDKLYPPGAAKHNSDNMPYGSSTSINSGSSSRSWAETVKGGSDDASPRSSTRSQPGSTPRSHHASVEDVSSGGLGAGGGGGVGGKGVDEEGWCTVRRTRSRFGQTTSGSQASLKGREHNRNVSKMKNRYNLPSSAVSMPSLASMQVNEAEQVDEECERASSSRSGHPALEKSASSASIVRSREARVTRLGSVSERTGAGSSADSVHDEDPSYIKKKKDEMNQSKQRILKKSNSTPQSRKGSGQSNSSPQSRKGSGQSSSKGSAPQSRKSSGQTTSQSCADDRDLTDGHLKSLPDLGQDTDPDTDNEEIRQRDEAIAKAESDAAQLQKELRETEQSELTDTDVETDTIATEDSGVSDENRSTNTGSEVAENIWEGLSWAEQMELEEQLAQAEAVEARLPGRAIQLHEKLSSPARKKEPHETFKHYQEKQDKARLRRQMFSEEKAIKLAQLNQKISEVLEQRDRLVDERKIMIEAKLRKAEEKRIQHIEGIRRKAHEEEEKLKEIAFINELQAQNARIDMITQVSTADEKCEERLAVLAEEKAKKAEQREEREARAEERRREMEEARQRNLEAMISRRKQREERIQGSQAAAREKRKVSARQKDKERLEKLSTVRAAETDMKEELKEKIMQKQEDAAKRHAEHLEDIRQKAFELSVQKCSNDEGVPIIKPYENKKKCKICNVLIRSEVHLQSHLRGKKHSEELERNAEGKKLSGEEITDYNIKQIIDAPEGETDPITVKAKERVKLVKRRAKKLKVKLEMKGEEYTQSLSAPNRHLDSPHRAKIGKSLREIDKLLNSQGKGAWPNQAVSQLERNLGEIFRSLEKKFSKDQDVFFNLGGFDVLAKIYDKVLEGKGGNNCPIPIKAIVSCGKVLLKATLNHQGNCEFLLMSNRVSKFIELLRGQLARLVPSSPLEVEFDVNPGPETDPLSKSVMQFLSEFILQLSKTTLNDNTKSRLQDLVSYIVSVETVDNLAGYFQLVRNPIDSSPEVAEFLLVALQFLSSLTGAVDSNNEAHTLLLSTLQWTELAGTVSLLYGMLLHQGRDTARDTSPPPLPTHTLAVATETCTLLQRLVSQNLVMVQSVLASEGISLEFRHIASYLLWYTQCHSHAPLLNQVIILVGYFTANHPDNQTIVQEGSQPSVLQQLANLPFQYFSQPELKHVLFPTLLSCCHNNSVNMEILTAEMSWQLIQDYIKTSEAKSSQLVKLVLPQGEL